MKKLFHSLIMVLFCIGAPLQAADLSVVGRTITPDRPGMGDIVSFEATIRNAGPNNAGTHITRVVVEGPNGFPTQTQQYSRSAQAGQTYTVRKTHRCTEWGFYRYRVTVDVNNNVVESDETSRSNEATFYVGCRPLADLVVCAKPESANAGRKKKIVVRVHNRGQERSLPCLLRWYIEGNGVKWRWIPELEPGESHPFTRHARWYTRGTKRMVMHVDARGRNLVEEINENNNRLEVPIWVFRLFEFDTSSGGVNWVCSDD